MDSYGTHNRGDTPPPRMPSSAGLRAVRSPLARAIAVTLVVKLCVVVAMRVFLFDGAHRPVIDDAVMNHRLTAPTAPYR